MSKKVTIPTDGGNPFVVILGGIKYVYKPGETVEVPDGVALEIEEWERWRDKHRGAVQPPFAAGGGGVQPDLSQNDPNAADYVKNRTHYEEVIPMIEKQTVTVVANPDLGGIPMSEISVGATPNTGDTVVVEFNGVQYSCVADGSPSSMLALGNSSIFGMSGDTGEPFLILLTSNGSILVTKELLSVTISAAIVRVSKLDNVFLQDSVAKYGAIGEVTCIEWDGNTNGLDKFVVNSFNYYKVSDIAIPPEHLVRCLSKRSDENNVSNSKDMGTNCYELRGAIVVTAAGECANYMGKSFVAPSTGTYFLHNEFTDGLAWCEYVEFDTRRENAILYLTNACGVKYAISVDDNGNLTATETT